MGAARVAGLDAARAEPEALAAGFAFEAAAGFAFEAAAGADFVLAAPAGFVSRGGAVVLAALGPAVAAGFDLVTSLAAAASPAASGAAARPVAAGCDSSTAATPIELESVRWQLSQVTIVRTSAPSCRSSRRRVRGRAQKEQKATSVVTRV